MRVLTILIVIACLAGCGYKAPLYLPKPKPEGRKSGPVVLPDPVPQRPMPSESAPAPK